MFALPGEPGLDGVFFLSAHEVENLILLYGGIYELIPKNVRLASQGEFDGARLRVVVAYDVSDSPLMLMGGMLPRPPAVIRRVAVIQVGDPS